MGVSVDGYLGMGVLDGGNTSDVRDESGGTEGCGGVSGRVE